MADAETWLVATSRDTLDSHSASFVPQTATADWI